MGKIGYRRTPDGYSGEKVNKTEEKVEKTLSHKREIQNKHFYEDDQMNLKPLQAY